MNGICSDLKCILKVTLPALPLFLMSLSSSVFVTLPLAFLSSYYSYSLTISVHQDELWAPQLTWCIGVQRVRSSLLRDSFNCHILLCSPTATNTISLNNLAFLGRDILRSCLFYIRISTGRVRWEKWYIWSLDFLKVLFLVSEQMTKIVMFFILWKVDI